MVQCLEVQGMGQCLHVAGNEAEKRNRDRTRSHLGAFQVIVEVTLHATGISGSLPPEKQLCRNSL